ncbi:MAG: PEP-utilizing enzyme [Myxococcota bacterium]
MSTIDPEAPNVLHTLGRHASWSRANEKGVFPGVSTPLNWSIWGEIGERAVRQGACDLGLLDEHELEPPASIDDWGWSIFYGRPAANVDTWRRMYERGLGGAGQGAATQRQVFGGAGAGGDAGPRAGSDGGVGGGAGPVARGPTSGSATAADATGALDPVRRRTLIEAKRPIALATSPARLRATRREAIAWWREATRAMSGGDPGVATRCLREALALFERADRDHIVVSLLSTEAVTALSAAAEAAGRPDAANALMVGSPGMEEFETAVAVWDLSRGRIDLDAFLAEHGFHGAMEGEIASRSWREDPAPIRTLVGRYAKLAEDADPRRREAHAVEARGRLEAELLANVPSDERGALSATFALAATCLPMREAGRATLTIALDAMRAAARVVGRAWAASGTLATADDVFLATRFELLAPPADLRARVEARRALVAEYERFDLPETWQGMPEKVARVRLPADSQSGDQAEERGASLAVGSRLEGLGASAGLHEGIARVVLDPSDPALEFEAGDVLVAPATDPSWAPLFLVAGAVVIDTGSNISHAAVVAREMGIPAVVAVREASLRIRGGQRLRVDGKTGIVEMIGD